MPRRAPRRAPPPPADERLRAPRPQAADGEAGRRRLGELEAVALVVAPAAQVRRPAFLALDLHAHHVDEEPQARLRLRGQELDRPEVRDLAHDATPSTFARRPSRSYDSAPPASFAPLTRSFCSRSRAAASTSSTRSASITATPSASSTTMSPGLIVAPPTYTGTSSSPAVAFTAPWMRTQRAQVGGPSSASSSTSRTEA